MHLSVGEMRSGGRRIIFHRLREGSHRAATDPVSLRGIAVRNRWRRHPAEPHGRDGVRSRSRVEPAIGRHQQLSQGRSVACWTRALIQQVEKIESALDRAAEQAIRAGQIIRRLRSFVSRGETEKRVESIAKLVEEAGALGLVGAREQGVVLRFDLNPNCDLVLADRVPDPAGLGQSLPQRPRGHAGIGPQGTHGIEYPD